jgi:D-alanyl-D-alanine carboxypeptidase/D-alanyl-D-alanine-endopeptidase (penicillin-binding protein 4)
LGRAVARRSGRAASFAGEARSIKAAVRRLGVPVDGIRLYDASGLSRLDRVTPRALAAVLRIVAARPESIAPVAQGLPVAGLTGTLADRYRHGRPEQASGVLRAKTGTLAGVSALAGQVVDADGRLLLFAFLTDRAALPSTTETALDRLVARLSACGCT